MRNGQAFATREPAIYAWLKSNAPRFDFAASLLLSVERWGNLTVNQRAAVQRCMSRPAPKPVTGEAVNVDSLQAAFDRAASAGLKRPKLRFATFDCSLAPATGKNPGAIYVKGGDDVYLGKVTGGQFFASRDCSPQRRADVVSVLQDPLAAAVAYGRRTGACSCCGRELSDPVSVERGIGPICAAKYGW